MKEELISIIINVYNGEKYINKCLDSVINQTYKNIEILIVNDGSTDSTLDICKSYKDRRIKIISTKNQGLSLSRNTGIDNAKGKYLYFIDADDYVDLDAVAYLYRLIKKYNVKISMCRSIDVYHKKTLMKKNKERIYLLSQEEILEKNLLSLDNSITMWNKLFDATLLKDLRFENRIINDLSLTYKIYLKTDEVVFSSLVKYYYVRNNSSISVKKKNDFYRNADIFKVSLDRYNNVKKFHARLVSNDIGLLRNIVILYNKDNKKLHSFLDKQDATKIFKEKFSLKFLFHKNFKFKEKMMFVAFRINKKSCFFLFNSFRKLAKRIYVD